MSVPVPSPPADPPYKAASPLATLFGLALVLKAASEEADCQDAVKAADHHVYSQYFDTLGKALEAGDWTGRPAVKDNGRLGPSAVAWLDGGLWLHHTTAVNDAAPAHVLTLLAPCLCGHGYVGYELEDEGDLLSVLADLLPNHGGAPHESDRDGPYCASVGTSPTART